MVFVATFCCCCSLKTGTLIIGAVSVILSTSSFIEMIRGAILESRPSDSESGNVFIVGAIMAIITIIVSLLLIIGAAMSHMRLLVPWIIILPIDSIIAFIYAVYKLIVNDSTFTGLDIISVDVLCIFVGIGVVVYLLMVVYSHFVELKKGKKEKRVKHELQESH